MHTVLSMALTIQVQSFLITSVEIAAVTFLKGKKIHDIAKLGHI